MTERTRLYPGLADLVEELGTPNLYEAHAAAPHIALAVSDRVNLDETVVVSVCVTKFRTSVTLFTRKIL